MSRYTHIYEQVHNQKNTFALATLLTSSLLLLLQAILGTIIDLFKNDMNVLVSKVEKNLKALRSSKSLKTSQQVGLQPYISNHHACRTQIPETRLMAL